MKLFSVIMEVGFLGGLIWAIYAKEYGAIIACAVGLLAFGGLLLDLCRQKAPPKAPRQGYIDHQDNDRFKV